ncbi:hypothetical protein DES40_0903 [Litorimonas taeanensis]|uniref:Ancillary SecYEG translocon subunit/Cell division coordinator CpoB TPR domain-containing protein n=1 Tax=Litorimonas taeanensis TaxID=568099 RepID=A0A420WKN2_9PROT|nr:tetratricopeptide repeat protein [Litorimonas taeanensis]RKQ71578.1 hypothetical protein DES40_0903 [Litorimonas taeanensis]
MVDFINEVEEELRKDDYNKLLKRYGPALGVIIFLIIAGTAVFEWKKSSDDRVARAASASYISAAELAQNGEVDRAVDSFLALADKAPAGYSGLSLMRAATLELEQGSRAKAVALFDEAAAQFKLPRHAHLAKLKAAYILADNGAYADVSMRLDSLAAKDAPYEYLARELAGFVAFQSGDMTTARQEFTYLKSIPGVPSSIAQRATQYLSLVPAELEAETVAPEPLTTEPVEAELETTLPDTNSNTINDSENEAETPRE